MTAEVPDLVRGRPRIGIPGRAAWEQEPGLPSGPAVRGDIVMGEAWSKQWRVLGASARGLAHRYTGKPRQDSFGISSVSDKRLVAVVADGVSQFDRSHEAADAAVEELVRRMSAGEDAHAAIIELNELLQVRANDGGGSLATTVVLALLETTPLMPVISRIAWVGDASAWLLCADGWTCLTELDEVGAYATSETKCLPSAEPTIREAAIEVPVGSAFFLMTDGVGKPLQDIEAVRRTTQEWWIQPPDIYQFASQVEFVRRSHIDDRTVVGVWPTPPDTSGSDAQRSAGLLLPAVEEAK